MPCRCPEAVAFIAGKGDRRLLCGAPFGPFRQKVPVTFSGLATTPPPPNLFLHRFPYKRRGFSRRWPPDRQRGSERRGRSAGVFPGPGRRHLRRRRFFSPPADQSPPPPAGLRRSLG